jgi:hypothetical protein
MDYETLLETYRRRNRSALVDGITTALSHVDEVTVGLGLMEDSGLMAELLGTLSLGLPFAVIAVTEQGAVVLGRKTQKAALQDASYRMLKTGAGLAAGAAVMAAGAGALPAIPVAVGVRLALDRYRSSLLTARRVKRRTDRVAALNEARRARNLSALS